MIEISERVTAYLEELADSAHAVADLDGVRLGQSRSATAPAVDRARQASRAAAAILVVGAVGALTYGAIDDDSDAAVRSTTQTSLDLPAETAAPTTTVEPSGRTPVAQSSSMNGRHSTLGPDEWVIPARTPAGFRPLWGLREPAYRSLLFGDDAGTTINIDVVTDPTVETLRVAGVEVAGATWYAEETSPGFSIAMRDVGNTRVSISANGNTDLPQLFELIESLTTVHEDQLPVDVVEPTEDAFVPVATYDSSDGPVTLSAYEVNDKFCTQAVWTHTTSQTCVLTLDVAGVMSAVLGGGYQRVADADATLVEAAGVVRGDVARLSVELEDGQQLDITPTDLSGRFDTKFWLLSATMATPSETWPPSRQIRPIVRVTAFDASGQVLATEP